MLQYSMMSDFEVQLGEAQSPSDFYVRFPGPKDSPVLYQSALIRYCTDHMFCSHVHNSMKVVYGVYM
jgi:hypothetical protein